MKILPIKSYVEFEMTYDEYRAFLSIVLNYVDEYGHQVLTENKNGPCKVWMIVEPSKQPRLIALFEEFKSENKISVDEWPVVEIEIKNITYEQHKCLLLRLKDVSASWWQKQGTVGLYSVPCNFAHIIYEFIKEMNHEIN